MTPEFYVVGGAVRDVMLGIKPSDIDYLVVGATEEWMLSRGFTKVGADFPVFLKNGEEYALARTERKTGRGYHGFEANWATTITVEEDLSRRDLTVNSMAVPLAEWEAFVATLAGDQTGVDPTEKLDQCIGGTRDVLDRVIRANGGAFVEDPVRVFRALRFAVTLPSEDGAWSIAPTTVTQIKHMAASEDFAALTHERVVQEILKTAHKCATYRQFSTFLALLGEMGALQTVFEVAGTPFQSTYDEDCGSNVTTAEAVGMLVMSRAEGVSVAHAVDVLRQRKFPGDALDYAATLGYLVEEFIVSDAFVSGDRLLAAMSKIKHKHYHSVISFMLRNGMFESKTGLLQSLEYAQIVWETYGFDDLSDDQKESLSGKAIGLAIWGLKLAALNDFVARREHNLRSNHQLSLL